MPHFVAFEHQPLRALIPTPGGAPGQTLGGPLQPTLQEATALTRYLDEVWASRNAFLDEEEIESRGRSSKAQQYLGWGPGGQLVAHKYVGIVQYEGLRLEIFPKILGWKGYNITDAAARGGMHQHLLYWLMYVEKIHFPFSILDLSQTESQDMPEILIHLFAQHTYNLLAEQPYQAYHPVTEGLGTLRGRLDMPAYIRDNLATGRWHRLTCSYEPFVYDNRFNRIVKCVARKLQAITGLPANRRRLEDILFLLDEVTDEACQEADCDKVRLNPLYTDLELVLSMARMFLSNRILDLRESDQRNFCLLLPMEVVFEGFIAGFFKEHFKDKYSVTTQRTTNLARRLDGPYAGTEAFQMKSDIVLEVLETKVCMVIDTKYKAFQPEDLKAGIAQGDMYQMVAYALKRKARNVFLVYPQHTTKGVARFKVVINQGKEGEMQNYITAYSTDICLDREDMIGPITWEKLEGRIKEHLINGMTQ